MSLRGCWFLDKYPNLVRKENGGMSVVLRQVNLTNISEALVLIEKINEIPESSGTVIMNSRGGENELQSMIGSPDSELFLIHIDSGEDVGIAEYHWSNRRGVRAAEVGVAVSDPALWKLGYGADAVYSLCEKLFLEENADRVQYSIVANNLDAVKAMCHPMGPVFEGIRRDAAFSEGLLQDIFLFGVLRREFLEFLELAPGRANAMEIADERRRKGAVWLAEHLRKHPECAAGPGEILDGTQMRQGSST